MRIRTGYSFRTAAGTLENVMSRLIECGYQYAPISDRGSTFAYNRWAKLAAKNNLRPIFGVELAVTTMLKDKKHDTDHWTFFATDDIGSINRLLLLATRQFYMEPLLTYEQAVNAEGLIKIAGKRALLEHMGGPRDDLFVALSPSTVRSYIKAVQKAGHRFVACSDNLYPRQDDFPFYELVVDRDATRQTYPQHILTDEEWVNASNAESAELEQEAIANMVLIAEQCQAKLVKGELLHPPVKKTLRSLCEEGAKRIGCNIKDPVYAARLKRELELIATKKFEDYFFIIADVCQWARKEMIVGPARGSSCGSLVCYLLEITTVDPIKYDLLFERFIDIDRADLPDIDIDFSDVNRDMVFKYMEEKYGAERVARLGTVALFKPRSALQAAGAAFNIPRWRTDAFADTIIKRSSGDSRALQTFVDTLQNTDIGRKLKEEWPQIELATIMEGHPRHYSQHAAGIILTDKPVTNYVAIDARHGATMCDKKDAEEMNLLKIDALGLTQLSIFEDALKMAGLPHNHLETVPLDDQAAFDVLNNKHFGGVFQFNGSALQSLCNQVKINHLEDIISITALARPGPLASGGATTWVKRKNGIEATTYPHPLFEPDLKRTLGVVMYQEQVMQIGRNVGSLSWEDVSALRKAMSKSLGKEWFSQYGIRFIAGAIEKGIDPVVAEKVWDELCAYGAMAFNRSHAVAYGIISYWCCWMKAHYPVEFGAASLTHESDPDKQIIMLRELNDEAVPYKAVDRRFSTDKWTVANVDGNKMLIGPVQNVKGIGPKAVQEILSHRADPIRNKLSAKVDKLLTEARTSLDSLWPVRDAIRRVMPDPAERNIYTPPTQIKELIEGTAQGDFLIFGVAHKIAPRDENEAVNVAKRGGQMITDGMTNSLNLFMRDDTGQIFCKVSRYNYEQLGRPIVERGGQGKALYAIKGYVRGDSTFRMISVKQVRFLGMMEEPIGKLSDQSQKSAGQSLLDLGENTGVAG